MTDIWQLQPPVQDEQYLPQLQCHTFPALILPLLLADCRDPKWTLHLHLNTVTYSAEVWPTSDSCSHRSKMHNVPQNVVTLKETKKASKYRQQHKWAASYQIWTSTLSVSQNGQFCHNWYSLLVFRLCSRKSNCRTLFRMSRLATWNSEEPGQYHSLQMFTKYPQTHLVRYRQRWVLHDKFTQNT